jgi:hypothetical protein
LQSDGIAGEQLRTLLFKNLAMCCKQLHPECSPEDGFEDSTQLILANVHVPEHELIVGNVRNGEISWPDNPATIKSITINLGALVAVAGIRLGLSESADLSFDQSNFRFIVDGSIIEITENESTPDGYLLFSAGVVLGRFISIEEIFPEQVKLISKISVKLMSALA